MNPRVAHHEVDALFLERWSPRSFDAQPMPHADVLSLFEAARWAPSAFNIQPWRFVYALREDEVWSEFVDLLVPFNAGWAQHASALVFVLSDTLITGADGTTTPSGTHRFDAGAAWGYFALQAVRLGYRARGMAGVQYEKAREYLGVPERFQIEIAIAVGRATQPDHLPPELQEKEGPTPRKPVSELAFRGGFPAD